MSLFQFAFFVSVLTISLSTQSIFDYLGNTWTFLLFCGFNLFGGIFVAIFIKEIDGLSKNEIKALYEPD